MNKRAREGFGNHLKLDVALRRLGELKSRYHDTFRQLLLCGSGEPIMPGVEPLLEGANELGLAIHCYTAGKHLGRRRLREPLVRAATQIRISLDAVNEATFRVTHAASGFDDRVDNLRKVIEERNIQGSKAMVGVSMVIQEANWDQIVPFAEFAKKVGCDFVAIHHESYGKVTSGFNADQGRRIMADLIAVEELVDARFSVNTPQLGRRHTVFTRRASELTSIETMDRCFFARQRPTLGSFTDYAACPISGGNRDYKENSWVGPLDDDTTIETMHAVIDKGVGTASGRPLRLNCANCEARVHDDLVLATLTHLDDETDWDVELLPYVPNSAAQYRLALGSEKPGNVLVVGQDGEISHHQQLRIVAVR